MLPATVPEEDAVTLDHNSYGTSWMFDQYPKTLPRSDEDGLFRLIHAYHRIFYEHRGTYHQLGYGHAGKVGPEFAPELAGSGKDEAHRRMGSIRPPLRTAARRLGFSQTPVADRSQSLSSTCPSIPSGLLRSCGGASLAMRRSSSTCSPLWSGTSARRTGHLPALKSFSIIRSDTRDSTGMEMKSVSRAITSIS